MATTTPEIVLSDSQVDHYLTLFCEYKPSSVMRAMKCIIRKFGSLDAVTMQHYMAAPRFGGLGMGRRNLRHTRKHMKQLLTDSLAR